MNESTLKSIKEIFDKRLFRIPDYQRGYAWEEKQLEDFWDDIENLKDDQIHYTGMLTLEKIKNIEDGKWDKDRWLINDGYEFYHVVDGQQRITTIVVLINELVENILKTKGSNKEYLKKITQEFLYREERYQRSFIFGYENDNPSDEFFKTRILNKESSTADKQPEETLYTLNLKRAKEFFAGKIRNESELSQIKILEDVLSRFKFNLYKIDSQLDIFITFETMNNRGKPLSTLELLKNRLIYLTTILNNDGYNALRDEINEAWKTIYEYLGKNKDNKLSDDDFLKNHWIMFFKYNRERGKAYEHFLLNEYFTPKNKSLTLEDIKTYIGSIQESAKKWFFIHNPEYDKNMPAETKKCLLRLNRLGFLFSKPLIMATLINGGAEQSINDLLKEIERFVFLIFGISQARSGTENSNIYLIANKLYHKEISIDEVNKKIEELITGGERKGLLDIDAFVKYIDRNFDQKKDGFYGWTYLKYFLYEYEGYAQEKAKDNAKLLWIYVKKEESIEHIFPQTPDKECWIKNFGQFNDYQKYILTHSLGNLLLISPRKNSSVQNDCFLNKSDKYSTGSFSEIEVCKKYKQWTAQEIIDRGMELLNFLEQNWNITINQKEDILMRTEIFGGEAKNKLLSNDKYIIDNYLNDTNENIKNICLELRKYILLSGNGQIEEKHTSGGVISYQYKGNNFLLIQPHQDKINVRFVRIKPEDFANHDNANLEAIHDKNAIFTRLFIYSYDDLNNVKLLIDQGYEVFKKLKSNNYIK